MCYSEYYLPWQFEQVSITAWELLFWEKIYLPLLLGAPSGWKGEANTDVKPSPRLLSQNIWPAQPKWELYAKASGSELQWLKAELFLLLWEWGTADGAERAAGEVTSEATTAGCDRDLCPPLALQGHQCHTHCFHGLCSCDNDKKSIPILILLL